jgi:cytoskeletal protein RodZ
MAKEQHQFDSFFKQKLENHTERPSQLAWERIEDGLGKPKKKAFIGWYVAASLVLLLGLGYLLLRQGSMDDTLMEGNLVSQQLEEVSKGDETSLSSTEASAEITPSSSEPTTGIKSAETSKASKPQVVNEKAPAIETISQTIAQREVKEEVIALPELKLPELALDQSIALVETTITNAVDEEPSYTVTIRSSGIKAEAPKDNIIDELENKVDKIGGFISRGFADLQDAKSNLFALNTPRRKETNTN